MKSLGLLLFLLLIAGSVQARLGETKPQIEARYGKPVAGTETDGTHEKQSWRIHVHYNDGRAASERFTKIDGTELSRAEVEILLQRNGSTDPQKAASTDWVLIVSEKTRNRWRRANGNLAEFTYKSLRLWTKKLDDEELAKAADQERKRVDKEKKDLEGF